MPSLLISFDVAGTVAELVGRSHAQALTDLSPLPAPEVRRILRDVLGLKTLPSRDALTPALVRRTCTALMIDVGDFGFGTVPLAPYRLLDGARAAVAAAAVHAPVVLITNTSVFAESCLDPVREGLAPHLTAVHTSWRHGVVKPNPQVFHTVASHEGVGVEDLVHVGDSWCEDIAPVLELGGRAMWITDDASSAGDYVGCDRLVVVRSLDEATTAMTQRWWA